ncbi:MAG: PQQ-binding-like beta-propeller repeat protein, partial [Candidatus Hadarchaeales archaeon]
MAIVAMVLAACVPLTGAREFSNPSTSPEPAATAGIGGIASAPPAGRVPIILQQTALPIKNIEFSLDLDNIVKTIKKSPKSDSKGAQYDFGLDFKYHEYDNGWFDIAIGLSGSAGTPESEDNEGGKEGGEGGGPRKTGGSGGLSGEVSAGVEGQVTLFLVFDDSGKLVSYSVSGSIQVKIEIEVFTYKYFIAFSVGPVPVWIEINVSGKVGLSMSASGTILGEPRERANLSVKLYLGVELEALLYSAVGGSGGIEPFVEAKYFVDEGIWVIFGGVTLSLDAKFKIDGWMTYTLWSNEWEFSTPIMAFQRDAKMSGDAGDEMGQARDVTWTDTYIGYLGRDSFTKFDDTDWYKVALNRGGTLKASLMVGSEHSDEAGFDLTLYDGDGNPIAVRKTGENVVPIEYMATSSGYVYLEVKLNSGTWSWGTYVLQLSVEEHQDDIGSGGDAANRIEESLDMTPVLLPYPIPENGILSNDEFFGTDNCYLGGRDNADFYKIPQLSTGHSIKVRVKPPSGANFDVYVYDQSKRVVAAATVPDDSEETLSVRANTTGAYYVEVRRVSNVGDYSLEIEKKQRDVQDGDAPNVRDQSRAINAGQYTNCYLDDLDRDDFYVFSANAGQIIEVKLTAPQDARFWADLIDSNGSIIESTRNTMMVCATYSGNHYLRVWRESGRGMYNFEINIYSHDDGGTGRDAGSSTSTAAGPSPNTYTYTGGTTLGKEFTGWIGKGDESDIYKISLEGNKTLSVRLNAQDVNVGMRITNFTGTIISDDNIGLNRYFCGKAENYSGSRYVYIELSRVEGGGYYSVAFSIAAENDAGSGRDAGWFQGEEVTLATGENYRGYLDFCDTDDLYRVWLGMNDQLTVRMTPNNSGSNFDLYFYDSTAVYRKENAVPCMSSTNSGTNQDNITYLAYHAGWYYIRIKRAAGLGTYDLRLSAFSVPWPKEMHDVRNTGLGAYPGPENTTVGWKFKITQGANPNLSDPQDPPPIVGPDDTVYAASSDGFLYAFDRYGSIKWKVPFSGSIDYRCSPMIGPDGTVYFGYDNRFCAFDPKTGALKWSFLISGIPSEKIAASPNIGADGTIYFPSGWRIFALRPNGTLKWDTGSLPIYDACTPAIGPDGTVYVTAHDKLFALYPENGGVKWSFEAYPSWFIDQPPVIGPDGTIYFTQMHGPPIVWTLYAVRPSGTLKWSSTFENVMFSQSAVAVDSDGTIYVPANSLREVSPGNYWQENAILLAINPSNGSKKWTFSYPHPNTRTLSTASSPAIGSDNTIYFGLREFLFAVRKNGTLKWVFATGGVVNSPAIGRNKGIYFISKDGYLYAIEPDLTPPYSTVTYPADGEYLNSIGYIRGSATDYFSGVKRVDVRITRNSDGAYLTANGWSTIGGENAWLQATFSTTDNSWQLNLSQAQLASGESYTVWARGTDNVGNVENSNRSISFTFDNTPPTCSISINDGAESTRVTQVVLYLSHFDQASPVVGARYSNDGVNWSGWEAPSRTRSWVIDQSTGKVYFQVVDMAGNISEASSDTITYVAEEPPAPEPENFRYVLDTSPELRWSFENPLREDVFMVEVECLDTPAKVTLLTRSRSIRCALPGLSDLLENRLSDNSTRTLARFKWRVSLVAPFVGVIKSSSWNRFSLSRENMENLWSSLESLRSTRLFVGATENNMLQVGTLFRNGGEPIKGGLGGVVAIPARLQAFIEETNEVMPITSKVMVKVGSVAPGETIYASTRWAAPQGGSYQIRCETASAGVSGTSRPTETLKTVKTLPDLAVSEGDISYNESLNLVVVRVRNTGNASAGGFNVAVGIGESTTICWVEGLVAGNATTVTVPATLPRGTTLVTVSVDPEGEIGEIDETNNETQARVEATRGMPPEALFTYSPNSTNTE